MNLAIKISTGIMWNFAELVCARGVSLIVTLILAHFLSPGDFGLVAMIAVFIAIATSLMDSGFKQALIRLPNATDRDFNTAFCANLVLGAISYFLIFLAAPLIASFYVEPQLTLLIRISALVVIISSFQVVQYSILSRQLNFRAQFKAVFPASILSAFIAILAALSELGVWTLIIQMLSAALFRSIFLWWQCRWRPNWILSKKSLVVMYAFGYKLFLADILDIIFRNIYIVVIAKIFSISTAGIYFFVDKIRESVLSSFVISILNVTFPGLAKVNNDNARLKNGFQKTLKVTMFLISPMFLFIAALSDPLFKTFLPERWWDGILYLQLMCIGGVLLPLHALNLNILKVKGRSDLSLLVEVLKKIIMTIILFLSINFGIYGILIGQIVNSVLGFFVNAYFTKNLLDYSIYDQLVDSFPAVFLSGGVAVFLFYLQLIFIWNSFQELIFLVVVGVTTYYSIAKIFKLDSLSLVVSLVEKKYENLKDMRSHK